jgi:hypothetical protein
MGSVYTCLVLRDRERDRRSSPETVSDRVPGEDERALVCVACGHRITDEDWRIEMSGAHEHTFVNPGGFVHRIGCFGSAPGCIYLGPTQSAFSWFAGWTWQVAACARCRAQVGWIYRNSGQQFHGLILDAIRPAQR